MNHETLQANQQVNHYWNSPECVAKYDANHAEGVGAELDDQIWRQEFKTYLPPAPARVLDLGCGTGFASILLAQLGYDVTALDQSENMLKEALKKIQERQVQVQLVQGNVMSPQLLHNSFDIVMARWVFWTLPDPASALQHAYRMLAAGGTLVIFDGTWFKIPRNTSDTAQTDAQDSHRNQLWTSIYNPDFLTALPLLGDKPMEVLTGLMQAAGFIDIDSGYMPHANAMYRKHRDAEKWKEDQMYFVRAVKPKN